MNLSNSLLMSILLRIAYGFTVKGSSGPLVVPLGGSVLLPCSVDSLLSLKDLEVQWRRSDSQTLIHLYQDGDIRPEVQNEDYHDRAHFFTDDIKQGNFSLLLKNVRQEDEGQYTCTVHSGLESGETVVEIKDVERLIVSGSNKSLSVYVGEDVTLNCSVDSHIPAEEVSWKKRVKDEHILVLLYQNKDTQPEASDVQYRNRVEFFRDEIHIGNFSLRLKRVRTEDKGLYMCQVFAGRLSDNTTVTLGQLGSSYRPERNKYCSAEGYMSKSTLFQLSVSIKFGRMALRHLSTEDLITELFHFGIEVTEEERSKFKDNEVDGEAVDYGLTERMVSYRFEGLFKKQARFNRFVQQWKETVTLTLEPVPVHSEKATPESSHAIPSSAFPAVFIIPKFPRDVQTKLDQKPPCKMERSDHNKIIRTLYETMALIKMFPKCVRP